MRLVTLDRPPAGRVGALIGDEILDIGMAGDVHPLAPWVPQDLRSVLIAGDDGMEILRRVVGAVAEAGDARRQELRERGAVMPFAEAHLLAPLPRPAILACHGRAYRSHLAEMSGETKVPETPSGFLKNANAIIGHGAPIRLPAHARDMVDFEAEVSVVFGRPCHHVSRDEAMRHVVGITIVNDVSARDWVEHLRRTGNNDLNRLGKQFPGFAPMGPCVATLDEIADPADIHVTSRLNGNVMQDASTRDLIWSIPELIAHYSTWYRFEAGDVMTTGSPAGVGFARKPPIFLKPGDTVSVTVDGVGTLVNPVVDA
jgi:2-keto-4-pentenoate hydratase/2-oxohepta-3-ene-1,7-dioic acid hydratase in catechol pathway